VRRSPDPRDGRGVRVALTAKGRRTCDKAAAAYNDGRARVLARLDAEQIERIDEALRLLLDVFEHDRSARTSSDRTKADRTIPDRTNLARTSREGR
jgi:hypothetical protein